MVWNQKRVLDYNSWEINEIIFTGPKRKPYNPGSGPRLSGRRFWFGCFPFPAQRIRSVSLKSWIPPKWNWQKMSSARWRKRWTGVRHMDAGRKKRENKEEIHLWKNRMDVILRLSCQPWYFYAAAYSPRQVWHRKSQARLPWTPRHRTKRPRIQSP